MVLNPGDVSVHHPNVLPAPSICRPVESLKSSTGHNRDNKSATTLSYFQLYNVLVGQRWTNPRFQFYGARPINGCQKSGRSKVQARKVKVSSRGQSLERVKPLGIIVDDFFLSFARQVFAREMFLDQLAHVGAGGFVGKIGRPQ